MEVPNNKIPRLSPHEVISLMMPYVTDPDDRASASLVSKSWKDLESETREHVKVDLCYTAAPNRVIQRFPNLKYLKVKGKPRSLNQVPENWGGYASPWVNEIAFSKLKSLKSVHLRRMIVSDLDLDVLAMAISHQLQVLKLQCCSGFSTYGLFSIAKHCRKLETLVFERCAVLENNDAWLHELAQHNTSLKVLNFYKTKLDQIKSQDLEILATNCCSSLVSLKMGDFDILQLVGFFRKATNLEEFVGSSFNSDHHAPNKYAHMSFPQRLCRLGNMYMGNNEMPLLFPIASQIRELDLLFARLNTDDHCVLLERCPNLEVLETKNVIGDRGLEVLAQNCKKLKRLKIQPRKHAMNQGVTHVGLIHVARGCQELELISVIASNINNESLQTIGNNLKKLCDFRLLLFPAESLQSEWPLDEGVKSLLMGCKKLKRFWLFFEIGALTDVGMGYIGRYSENVRWMLLGNVGDSDEGLIALSEGCPKLQKLQMRGWVCFSDGALATAVMKLPSLRYIAEFNTRHRDLSLMTCPFWNFERISSRMIPKVNELGRLVHTSIKSLLLGYYSLDDKRTDYPKTVVHLGRPINFFQ